MYVTLEQLADRLAPWLGANLPKRKWSAEEQLHVGQMLSLTGRLLAYMDEETYGEQELTGLAKGWIFLFGQLEPVHQLVTVGRFTLEQEVALTALIERAVK